MQNLKTDIRCRSMFPLTDDRKLDGMSATFVAEYSHTATEDAIRHEEHYSVDRWIGFMT